MKIGIFPLQKPMIVHIFENDLFSFSESHSKLVWNLNKVHCLNVEPSRIHRLQ